jgi:hypothetical protein
MTVSATRTRELSINELVKSAYVMAGLLNYAQPLDNARGQWGRTLLETVTKNLEAQGIQVRSRGFETVALTTPTDRYNLSADVLDVIGPGQYLPASTTDIEHASSETMVEMVDQTRWHQLPTKDATGLPVLFWPNRAGALIEARVWPRPSENGWIRFPVQLLYPDSTDSNATPGLERPWAQYFIFELAWQLAESQEKSGEKVMRLQRTAQQKLMECRGFSAQRAGSQIIIDHDTGWS